MKTFLLILLVHGMGSCSMAMACQNTVPQAVAQSYIDAAALGQSVPGGQSCKELPSEPCLCFDVCEGWDVCELVDNWVDDLSKPIYLTECPQGQEGCEPVGYEQVKSGKKLANNLTKLFAKQAKKEVDDALEADLKQVESESRKGQRAIALFRVLNKRKNLTKQQKGQLLGNASVKAIMDALNSGSIDIAADLIQAYNADGVLVTEDDKAKLLQAIQ